MANAQSYTPESTISVYHEKQVKELCALHAVNNLMQDCNAFTQKDLDEICLRLSPSRFFNPHRSFFGTGNYDVNVLMSALQSIGYDVIWFDKRRLITELNFDNIFGFILNIPSDYKIAGVVPFNFNRKHWIAVRKIDNLYYNLDSKLKLPEVIGDEKLLIDFLSEQHTDKERILLLVVTKQVHDDQTWIRPKELPRGS